MGMGEDDGVQVTDSPREEVSTDDVFAVGKRALVLESEESSAGNPSTVDEYSASVGKLD